MRREIFNRLHADFERSVRLDQATGVEAWMARDVQLLLGYARWENFLKVIQKATLSCINAGQEMADHFLGVTKMVDLGSGARREIDDIALSRYACYLIAQNGDPSKDQIAFAQSYFAVQTRKQEVIQLRLVEIERLQARRKLSGSEKTLSGIIFEQLGEGKSFAIVRSRGDAALFGGNSTIEMKRRLKVPKGRTLADFLPTITIKAKDFANELTSFNIRKDDLDTYLAISHDHAKNNSDVRKLLTDRGIIPEPPTPAEDIRKLERRLKSETKQPSQIKSNPDVRPNRKKESR